MSQAGYPEESAAFFIGKKLINPACTEARSTAKLHCLLNISVLLFHTQMLVVSWAMSCSQNLAKYKYLLEFLLLF